MPKLVVSLKYATAAAEGFTPRRRSRSDGGERYAGDGYVHPTQAQPVEVVKRFHHLPSLTANVCSDDGTKVEVVKRLHHLPSGK